MPGFLFPVYAPPFQGHLHCGGTHGTSLKETWRPSSRVYLAFDAQAGDYSEKAHGIEH